MDELNSAMDQVLSDFRDKWRELNPQPLFDLIVGFVHAIDWKASVLPPRGAGAQCWRALRLLGPASVLAAR